MEEESVDEWKMHCIYFQRTVALHMHDRVSACLPDPLPFLLSRVAGEDLGSLVCQDNKGRLAWLVQTVSMEGMAHKDQQE